ncbi:chorismate mutase [bacterium c-19]|nr:chorismate mutase [bacterium c-19]
MDQLQSARKKINEIDAQMAKLFEERMQTVEEVIAYKLAHQMEILDTAREAQVIEKNTEYIKDKTYKGYYTEFITEVMRLSRAYQKTRIHHNQIAYAGTLGAFSHIAAMQLFPDDTLVHLPTFEEVVEQVESGEASYGVLPFENSYTGEVGENMDLILSHNICIHRMYDLKIHQNLLGIKGAEISDIRQVYSKDQAISQSKKFLEGRNIECIPYPNTAMAAQYIAEQNDITKAAIAAKETAELYGLSILAEDINTSSDNTTRFIVIGKQLPAEGNRISLVFTLPHTTGSLAKVMAIISDHGFNMESIHSRSLKDEPFAYYFYVELVAQLDSKEFKELYAAMKLLCKEIKIAGYYTKESRDEA